MRQKHMESGGKREGTGSTVEVLYITSTCITAEYPEVGGKEAGSRGYALMQWQSKNQST
jgi:hypothetical protein